MTGLLARVDEAERRLVDALELEPSGVAAQLAGTWKGAPVRVDARTYRGARVRHARFVAVRGEGLTIGNVLVLPALDQPLPILGVELVDLGRESVLAVADLSPVLPDTHLTPWARGHAERARLPSAGALPAWCTRWFSSYALFARAPTAEAGAAAAQAWEAFVTLALGSVAAASSSALVAEAQAAYCRDHLDHDRGLHLLHKIVGPTDADAFLRDVMFPLPAYRSSP